MENVSCGLAKSYKETHPRMTAAFFNLRARLLLWLSSYLSVSSTISSEMISSIMSGDNEVNYRRAISYELTYLPA